MLYCIKKSIIICGFISFFLNAKPDAHGLNTVLSSKEFIKKQHIENTFDAIVDILKPHHGSLWCGELYHVAEAVLFSLEHLPASLGHLMLNDVSVVLAHRASPCGGIQLDKALPFNIWSVSEVRCTARCDRTLRHVARKNKTFYFEITNGELLGEGGVNCSLKESNLSIQTTQTLTAALEQLGWLTGRNAWAKEFPSRGIKGLLAVN